MKKENIITLLFGLVLAFALLEALLRIFPIYTTNFTKPNPYFGWSHIENKEGWFLPSGGCTGEFATYVKINSKGLRDYEHEYSKPENVTRVLILGDSFMEGFQVELNQTFAKRLEALFSNSENKKEIEIINAGTGGYGTDNELLFYKYEGYKYMPDIVILFFFGGNDPIDNYYRLNLKRSINVNSNNETLESLYTQKPFFIIKNGKLILKNFPSSYSKETTTIIKDLFRDCRLCFLIKHLLTKIASSNNINKSMEVLNKLYDKEYNSEYITAWKITEKLLDEIKDVVEKNNSKFLVVYIPRKEEIGQGRLGNNFYIKKVQNMFLNICKTNNLTCINLSPYFEKIFQTTQQKLYYDCDGHWNSYGHELAAKIIFKYINNSF